MSEEHAAPQQNDIPPENDILPEEEEVGEFAAGDSGVEQALETIAASIEAATEAVPAHVVHLIEAVSEETDARTEPQSSPHSFEAAALVGLDFAAPVKTASEWRKTTAEAWNESATALIDLASALTKARTVSEVLDLQARFARERLEGFAKLSSSYAELAQRAAKDAGVAAFRFSKSA
ncbi:MAG TPA: phasin family protein [Methylocystis sp.]|nr:phasin family protein [Methylocystis sp.]